MVASELVGATRELVALTREFVDVALLLFSTVDDVSMVAEEC